LYIFYCYFIIFLDQLLDKLKSYDLQSNISDLKFVDTCLSSKFKTNLNISSSDTQEKNNPVISNKNTITELSKLQTNFSKETVKKEIDDQYSNKIKLLKSKFEASIQDLIKVKIKLNLFIRYRKTFR